GRDRPMHDPDRDATPSPRSDQPVRRRMPVLAICHGTQELNVAIGRTLPQRRLEMPEKVHHRRRRGEMTLDERYGPAHPVALTPDGYFAELAGCTEIMVNSLHGQGIDTPAPGLRIEAVAPDGQIEAVSLRSEEHTSELQSLAYL